MPKYYLSKLPGQYIIISPGNSESIAKYLIKWLLYDTNNMFSFTRDIDGSLSIILKYDVNNASNVNELEEIKKKTQLLESSEDYLCIRVNTATPAIDEVGLLTEISSFFSQHEIPILCMSTYNCNYFYYPTKFEGNLLDAIRGSSDYSYEEL
jgi:hypothetical protein